jgi:hypothetical protein
MFSRFHYETSLKMPLDVVASILRLGRKYEINKAKENAVRHIHHRLPTNLAAWTERDQEWHRPGHLSDILNLAHECGINSSIPTIAFCCLRGKSVVGLRITSLIGLL